MSAHRHQSPPRSRGAIAVALAAAVAFLAGIAGLLAGGTVANASSTSAGWLLKCSYTHSATDDPILHPLMPGMSHLHDFYGNPSTGASSTYASMTGAKSTCTSGDSAGYWTPALYRNGVKINPAGREQIYYRANNVASGTKVTPFPADFRMVAGNAMAASPAGNPELGSEIYFGCSDNSESGKPTAPVNCKSGAISVHIGFPNCWNGVQTHVNDTPNVVYPSGSSCPASHPIVLPRLIERFEYPVGSDSSGITLSSGPAYTFHADFWNTWDQPSLSHLVGSCLNADTNCGTDPANPAAPGGGTTTTPPAKPTTPAPSGKPTTRPTSPSTTGTMSTTTMSMPPTTPGAAASTGPNLTSSTTNAGLPPCAAPTSPAGEQNDTTEADGGH